ncbi:hypothetical protein K469DRAFT_503626, partial [Zopfia rhizophila CBS 207.26]
INLGETPTARTIYTVVSLTCMLILALMLGMRARYFKQSVVNRFNFTSIMVLVMYFFAMAFIVSTAVVETGQGLRTHHICYSAAIICLVFYTGSKGALYIFLLERAHIVRAPFMRRTRDPIWLAGLFIIVAGFGTIAIIGYISPVVDLPTIDGLCRIGLPARVSFPLLSFDVTINIALTSVFIYLLRPVLSLKGRLSLSVFSGIRTSRKDRKIGGERTKKPHRTISAVHKNIRTLLWKSLFGSTLVMVPTAANMAQFYVMEGRELGWICLTICTLDVTWGVIVINWLTIKSAKAEQNLTKSA